MEGNIISISKIKKIHDITTIILSATASPEIYKLIYGEDNVVIHNSSKLKKYYETTQYTRHTMSQESLNILHKRGVLKDILKDSYNADVVFTHKSNLIFEPSDYFSKNTKIRFYGPSSQGINEFTGNNICLLGTPRPSNIQVFLIYAAITGDNDIKNNKVLDQDVKRGNYIGHGIKLFEDNTLKTIQENLIETKIIQAKGRSREVIKTEDNPWMHIYSNFPIDDPSIILK